MNHGVLREAAFITQPKAAKGDTKGATYTKLEFKQHPQAAPQVYRKHQGLCNEVNRRLHSGQTGGCVVSISAGRDSSRGCIRGIGGSQTEETLGQYSTPRPVLHLVTLIYCTTCSLCPCNSMSSIYAVQASWGKLMLKRILQP